MPILHRPKLLVSFLMPDEIDLVQVMSSRTGSIPSGEKNAAIDYSSTFM